MQIDDTFAKEHIHKWTKAWNDHNIKEVLSLYSYNISFSSPKIKSVYPNNTSSTITNKKDLEEYFCAGLKKFPMLHFIIVRKCGKLAMIYDKIYMRHNVYN